MIRTILIFGLISGVIVGAGMLASIIFVGGGGHSSLWLGYLVMLVALSAILVGVKSHRDRDLGGVIKFRTALLAGLGIAVVASVIYVAAWEAYLAITHYAFMDHYVASILAAKRAAGVSGAAYDKIAAEMETMRVQYRQPLYRFATTFIEIFPVGVLVAVVSAALLRNPRFLPARSAATVG